MVAKLLLKYKPDVNRKLGLFLKYRCLLNKPDCFYQNFGWVSWWVAKKFLPERFKSCHVTPRL